MMLMICTTLYCFCLLIDFIWFLLAFFFFFFCFSVLVVVFAIFLFLFHSRANRAILRCVAFSCDCVNALEWLLQNWQTFQNMKRQCGPQLPSPLYTSLYGTLYHLYTPSTLFIVCSLFTVQCVRPPLPKNIAIAYHCVKRHRRVSFGFWFHMSCCRKTLSLSAKLHRIRWIFVLNTIKWSRRYGISIWIRFGRALAISFGMTNEIAQFCLERGIIYYQFLSCR